MRLPDRIMFEQAAETFASLNRSRDCAKSIIRSRERNDVAASLVVPLGVKVFDVWLKNVARRTLAEWDES